MGHAGAIISGGQGTAKEKYAAMEAAGIRTVQSPAEIGQTLAAMIGKGGRSAPKKQAAPKPAKAKRGRRRR
jgi:succinyl-CoA synthetase alpha subunit